MGGKGSQVNLAPELLKTVACVCNHVMHGWLVHGTHVPTNADGLECTAI